MNENLNAVAIAAVATIEIEMDDRVALRSLRRELRLEGLETRRKGLALIVTGPSDEIAELTEEFTGVVVKVMGVGIVAGPSIAA